MRVNHYGTIWSEIYQMMAPSTVLPTSPGIQIALSYPFMLIFIVITIYIIYRFMKGKQIEPVMEGDWLEEENT